jgi:hypothetical protein
MRLGEGRIAEIAAQRVQLFVARGPAKAIGGKIVRPDVELLGQEAQDLGRNELAWPGQPAGIPQRAKLKGEAQAIMGPAPAVDCGKVRRAQGVMPGKGLLIRW